MKSRFTLIEMLVVLVIIVVLAGLIMVAVSKVRGKAHATQARSDMALLETAISSYSSKYLQIMPFQPSLGTSSDFLFTDISTPSFTQLHLALDGSDPDLNPRKIAFVSGEVATLDPWGKSYRVALDMEWDDDVEDAFVYGGTTQKKQIVIWSRGRDGLDNATDAHPSNKDNVNSWK